MSAANGKLAMPLSLEERLAKAGISADELADVVYRRIQGRIISDVRNLVSSLSTSQAANRQAILVAAVSGLAVRWKELSETPQQVAELAERLVDAIMREESRKAGRMVTGTGLP